ncbi:hypothetical protein PG997_002800 [Apiospora hydei]|uniref:Hydrophobin n=1 Tax=Apiospora hydei TaxID=1337664 RepID=A0ABR1WXF3_9PEZI
MRNVPVSNSIVGPNPFPFPNPNPDPALISGLTDATKTLLGNLGNASPPKLLWTPRPSPQCAAVNGGELQCCRGALAGTSRSSCSWRSCTGTS